MDFRCIILMLTRKEDTEILEILEQLLSYSIIVKFDVFLTLKS